MDVSNDIRSRLAIFFANDNNKVEAYLTKFGSSLSMSHINEIRALSPKQIQGLLQIEEQGDDPLYIVDVECPVCHYDKIPFRELRAKSLRTYQNHFCAPLYAGGNGYRNVNYNLYAVTVCKKCLFASPDRKDFRSFSPFTKQWTPSQLPPLVLMELVDNMGERMTMIEGDPFAGGLQAYPRPTGAAILSYRLAMERTEVEKRNGIALASFKKGFYWIKIALMQKMDGKDDTLSLEMAHHELSDAFRRSDFTSPAHEFQLCYTLAALNLRMGNRKECRQFAGILDQAKNDFAQGKRIDRENLSTLSQWIDRFNQLWEQREDDGLWDLPKAPN